MEAVFIVFMSLVSVICLFAVLMILKDMLEDMRAARERRMKELDAQLKERQQQIYLQTLPVVAPTTAVPAPVQESAPAPQTIASAVEPAPVAIPVVEEKVEVPVVEEPIAEEPAVIEEPIAEEVQEDDDSVKFSAGGVKQTLDDKYLALSQEAKGYYDEIVKCANNVENVKRFKNARYEEYKVGNSRIVRLLIKRETVIAEFILQNSDFKSYVSENKVAIRPAPTVLKITNSEMLKTACDSIEIVVKQIEAEKEAKRLEMLERRRERRRAKASE